MAAVKKCPPDVQELLYGNVIVTGGTAALPGFDARLLEELRPLVPDQFQLGVRRPPKPELAAWRGAAAFAATPVREAGTRAPALRAALSPTAYTTYSLKHMLIVLESC